MKVVAYLTLMLACHTRVQPIRPKSRTYRGIAAGFCVREPSIISIRWVSITWVIEKKKRSEKLSLGPMNNSLLQGNLVSSQLTLHTIAMPRMPVTPSVHTKPDLAGKECL